MKNKNWIIALIIIIPLVGLLFNIYALLIVLPLGVFLRKK
tara:strand:+ start:1657 stop:1776 length:120 start_codon:yes stop_codon:yes gene_type:complete